MKKHDKNGKTFMFGVEMVERPYIPFTGKKVPTCSAKELVAAHKKALDKLAKM